ncbi:hypothetical protein KIN20_016749 [Parelaphostrongylus tenuis]|uniref:Uncharacterized protein n=1 Tax=Parelaphostrongylus tenuis TaxID=148309 RepID=A0AAD5MHS8_PARTN|nr:hypothetical protein KIN20_016749 [Parelaphostrongylus tenuis]
MPVLEKCENACRVTADSTPPRPSTKRQRNDDLGTTGNPITVSPSPTASRISREVSSERTQQPVFLTLRRKRPLGAHVEVSESDHIADMTLVNTLENPTVEFREGSAKLKDCLRFGRPRIGWEAVIETNGEDPTLIVGELGDDFDCGSCRCNRALRH